MADETPPYPTKYPLSGCKTIPDHADDALKQFLRDLAGQPFCRVQNGGKYTKCTCLHVLQQEPALVDGVAEFMKYFFILPKEQKQCMVMEWIRYSSLLDTRRGDGQIFLLPVRVYLTAQPTRTCINAIRKIINMQKTAWKTCKDCVETNSYPVHGLIGKASNRSKQFAQCVQPSLEGFFSELATLAEPVATRLVRDATGLTTRDDDVDAVMLPTNLTKRGLYKTWLREHDEDGGDDEVQLLMEQKILNASQHVQFAIAQRALVNRKMEEAQADRANNVPHNQRHYTFIGDYSQNLYLPQMGSTQPGETYFYSPANVYQFGVVDGSTSPSELRAYIYIEGEAKKGGDNVASLLLKDLSDRGLLDKSKGPGKELTLVFDNCTGQNKNRMVLRTLLFLVESGYFLEASAVFLIRGHTKNACDRMFNLLKKEYRKQNLYIPEDLMEVLNSQRHVTAIRCSPDVHKAWDEKLNTYYKLPKNIPITKNHIFRVSSEAPTNLSYCAADVEEAPWLTDNLAKPGIALADRVDLLDTAYITADVVPGTGMKEIKLVELHDKWGPLVPPEKRVQWSVYCVPPSVDVRRRAKGQRSDPAAVKLAKASQAAAAAAMQEAALASSGAGLPAPVQLFPAGGINTNDGASL